MWLLTPKQKEHLANIRVKSAAARAIPTEVLERARAMLAEGMHLKEVASELRVGKSALHRATLGLAPAPTSEERKAWAHKAGMASALARTKKREDRLGLELDGKRPLPLWKRALERRELEQRQK